MKICKTNFAFLFLLVSNRLFPFPMTTAWCKTHHILVHPVRFVWKQKQRFTFWAKRKRFLIFFFLPVAEPHTAQWAALRQTRMVYLNVKQSENIFRSDIIESKEKDSNFQFDLRLHVWPCFSIPFPNHLLIFDDVVLPLTIHHHIWLDFLPCHLFWPLIWSIVVWNTLRCQSVRQNEIYQAQRTDFHS